MSEHTENLTPDRVITEVKGYCVSRGLECHPFKMGWYNNIVEPRFQLPHAPDTLALLIISTPSMFDRLFKPFVTSSSYIPGAFDPLDQCMKETFDNLKTIFSDQSVEAIQDFELHPNKRPKVLVQTAGHVAGAARYYQRNDVDKPDPWGSDTKIFGASVHPTFGGWFALRGVLIFKDVLVPDLIQKEPLDCLPTREMRIDLLHKYNTSWQDWTFREVTSLKIIERYSDEQKTYFVTPPRERHKLVSYLLTGSSLRQ